MTTPEHPYAKSYSIQMTQLKGQMGDDSYFVRACDASPLLLEELIRKYQTLTFSLRNTGDNLRVKNRFLQSTCQSLTRRVTQWQ